MNVQQVLSDKGADVITIAPGQSLTDAARLLSARRIGAVMVTAEDGSVRGILSERDIVRAIAIDGSIALGHPVSRHMTFSVVTCVRDTTLDELMEVMTTGKFRHVPVVESGRLVGVVSIGDVVKRKVAETEAEAQAMKNYISNAS